MSTFFYNRTLFNDLGLPIPDCYKDLDDAYSESGKSNRDQYTELEFIENVCRRHADVYFYALKIFDEYEDNPIPVLAAQRISTYLVGYFGAVKSFIDGIAIALNYKLELSLNPFEQDLSREKMWGKLEGHGIQDYESFRPFFSELKTWRNSASHRLYPIVITHAPRSAFHGKDPYKIERSEVEIKMLDAPGANQTSLMGNSGDFKWVSPIHYIEVWHENIKKLADMICLDFKNRIVK